MLYPNFEELVALKAKRVPLCYGSTRSVRTARQGNHHSPFRGQGLEFDAVRPYVFGDDIRNIDWRVTARTGSPHLKIFKEERERHVTICVDMNASMRFGTRGTFKSIQAARSAALIGWQSLANQDSVSGCLFGDVQEGVQYFSPKRTPQSVCSLLKILSQAPAQSHRIPIQQPLKQLNKVITPGSLIYLVSDFIDLKFHLQDESGLSMLRKSCDIVFIAINDPLDKALPKVGTLFFSSHARNKIAINTEDASGRAAYERLWQEDRERLYEMTNRWNIPLIELKTESEIVKELPLSLQQVSKRRAKCTLC